LIAVFDASALLAIDYYCSTPQHVFGQMIEMVSEGTVCFCDEVLEELHRMASAEWPYVWAKSVSERRRYRGGGYSTKILIAAQVQELIDSEATYEAAAPAVLAQAYDLREQGMDAHIVTEDTMEKPTRIPLAIACTRLDVPCKSTYEFLKAYNLLDL
jgi:hypothetical protein